MNSVSELPLLTPRPVALAEPGTRTAKAGSVAAQPPSVATAPVPEERPAARGHAPEPTRAQSAEQRLKKNRPEEGPSPIGASVPEVKLTFGDFLDLINPLQHIPIVSTIYRAITGDEIGGPAKILGGLLFGGPIGFIAAIFDTIVAQATGRDLGETVLAAFIDRDAAPAVQIAVAQDLEQTAAQDGAPADGSSTASRNPGPALGQTDPFGLERRLAAPIAQTPIAQTPGARAPVQDARPLAAAPPGPRTVTAPGIGRDERPLVLAAHRPDPSGIPVAAGAPVVAVELISADAPMPGSPRLVPSGATTGRGFAERMLEALDKYQAQAAQRLRGNSRADRRLDLNL